MCRRLCGISQRRLWCWRETRRLVARGCEPHCRRPAPAHPAPVGRSFRHPGHRRASCRIFCRSARSRRAGCHSDGSRPQWSSARSHCLVVAPLGTPPLGVTVGGGFVPGVLLAGGAWTGPVLAFGVCGFDAGVVGAAGEVGVGGVVVRVAGWGIGIDGESLLVRFSSWANVSGSGVLRGAVRVSGATSDSGAGICVSLVGRRGARSRRTDGCRRSCCTRELTIAGTAKPATAPEHPSANSPRHPICERASTTG